LCSCYDGCDLIRNCLDSERTVSPVRIILGVLVSYDVILVAVAIAWCWTTSEEEKGKDKVEDGRVLNWSLCQCIISFILGNFFLK
jgi:hypothetical protein